MGQHWRGVMRLDDLRRVDGVHAAATGVCDFKQGFRFLDQRFFGRLCAA